MDFSSTHEIKLVSKFEINPITRKFIRAIFRFRFSFPPPTTDLEIILFSYIVGCGKEKQNLKVESSAFAFVCLEISNLLKLEISTLLKLENSCLLLFSEGLKFQALEGLKSNVKTDDSSLRVIPKEATVGWCLPQETYPAISFFQTVLMLTHNITKSLIDTKMIQ